MMPTISNILHINRSNRNTRWLPEMIRWR